MCTLFWLLIKRLAMVSTGWNTNSSATPVWRTSLSGLRRRFWAWYDSPDAPDPSTRAVPESLLFPTTKGGDMGRRDTYDRFAKPPRNPPEGQVKGGRLWQIVGRWPGFEPAKETPPVEENPQEPC